MASKIQIFICYASQDEDLAKELGEYLGALRRQGFFEVYDSHSINAGMDWEKEIEMYLDTSHIVLLLVSAYFINSDFCYIKEVERVVERHNRKEAYVIPVILRPVHWDKTPFAGLQPLPENGKPVIDKSWFTQDYAFFNIAEGIRKVAEKLRCKEDGGKHC